MIKRKDKIIIAALELLNEGGINNITTKNLAAKQGITEPALYRQFKNKQDILLAIVNEFLSYDDKILNTIKEKKILGLEGLDFYIDRYTELYTNYSELTSVICSFDLFFYHDETLEVMKEGLEKRSKFLYEWFRKYPIKNVQLSTHTLSNLVNDIMYAEVLRWRLNKKSYNLNTGVKDKIYEIIGID